MRALKAFFPFLRWKAIVTKKNLSNDLIAGLLGAVIVLPQGVAFATIAGLPPEYGLYSAIVPAIVAALWGSSWHLVSGPTTAISLVVFATISPISPVGSSEYIDMVLTITFLVGLFQLLMGWMKIGRLLDFISHTVVVGFTAGAAILIASSQIKNFFGVKIPQGSSFYETLHIFFSRFDEINYYILIVGLAALFTGIFVKKMWPKFPYMIPAMLIGSLVGYYFNSRYGFDVTEIKTVGTLPGKLPPLSFPVFEMDVIKKLASPALAVTILALTEAVAISKAVALRSGQKVDTNQEVIGQGVSNIAGSFFSAYPASGSFNRSGLNFESGAKTPMASIFAAVFLAIILLFVAPLAAYLPVAVMAAILFLVAWGLIDFSHIKGIMKASRGETALLFVTFFSTLFIELEFAIFVGVLMSVALYLRNSAKPDIAPYVPNPLHPKRKFVNSEDLPQCPQLSILKIDGPIFFGSVSYIEYVTNSIREKNPEQKIFLLVFPGVNIIDLSGIDFLVKLIRDVRKDGGDVYFSNINKFVFKAMKKANLISVIGEENVFDSKPDAISVILPKLDQSKCQKCNLKIFSECEKRV